jgi:DNA polymerase V
VTYTVTCSEKLRKQKSNCGSLLLYIASDYFKKDIPQYSKSILIKLPYPTNSAIDLAKASISGLEQIFKEGISYRRAGVTVMNISKEDHMQLSLFSEFNPKHKSLMKTMDRINAEIGHHKVKLGSQDPGRTWKMKQEKLSPRYTTRLGEVITIRMH